MSALGPVLGEAAGRHSLTWRGQTVTFRLLELGVLEAYSRWLYERQKELLRQDKEELGEAAYLERLDALRASADTDFDFANPFVQKSLQTVPGLATILSICSGLSREDAVQMVVEKKDECLAILQDLKQDSFPKA